MKVIRHFRCCCRFEAKSCDFIQRCSEVYAVAFFGGCGDFSQHTRYGEMNDIYVRCMSHVCFFFSLRSNVFYYTSPCFFHLKHCYSWIYRYIHGGVGQGVGAGGRGAIPDLWVTEQSRTRGRGNDERVKVVCFGK